MSETDTGVVCPKGCLRPTGEPKPLVYVSKFDPEKGRFFYKYCMRCHYVEPVQHDPTWTPEPKTLNTKETAEEIIKAAENESDT